MNEISLSNNNFAINLQTNEKEIIERELKELELSPAQKSILSKDDILKEYYEQFEKEGYSGTLFDWVTFISSKFLEQDCKQSKDLSFESGLKDFNNQNNAILLLGLIPTLKTQIKSEKGVQNFIGWSNLVNTHELHVHSKDMDDLLVDSTGILLDRIGKGVLLNKYKSEDAVSDIKKILDATSKNCSHNFLTTFHDILRQICKSEKLEDRDKEKLKSSCLSSLREAIYIAEQTKIFSSFILGKYQLFTMIKEMGKTADDFEQSDLNSIIDSLFKIYFYTIDSFGNVLSETDKYEIFQALILYDNSTKRDLFVEKIVSEVSDNNREFSKYFSIKILESILVEVLPDTVTNQSIKEKCVGIIVDLYANDASKDIELNTYIKKSFDASTNKAVNELLLKRLLEVYNDDATDSEIKNNLYNLISNIFKDNKVSLTYSGLINDVIDVFLTHPQEPKSLELIQAFLEDNNIKPAIKEKFFERLENIFIECKKDTKTFIKKIIITRARKAIEKEEKEPFLGCVKLLKEITDDADETQSNDGKVAIKMLVDLYINFEKDRNTLKNCLYKIIKSNSSISSKKAFLDSLEEQKQYEDLTSDQRKLIYKILKDCLHDADENLILELYDTVVKNFIPFEFRKYKSDEKFSFQIGTEGDSIDRAKRWFKAILDSQNATHEHEEITSFTKKIILHGKNDVRIDFYKILQDSMLYKGNKKKLIDFSIDLLNDMVKL